MAMISDNLLMDGPNGQHLVGGKSKETGKIIFPAPVGGEAERYDRVALKTEGTLWSYTVQRFPPKEPFLGEKDLTKFKPYAVGYVELEGEVIVEARIDTDDFEALSVGQSMGLTTIEFAKDEAGNPLETYAFKPL